MTLVLSILAVVGLLGWLATPNERLVGPPLRRQRRSFWTGRWRDVPDRDI